MFLCVLCGLGVSFHVCEYEQIFLDGLSLCRGRGREGETAGDTPRAPKARLPFRNVHPFIHLFSQYVSVSNLMPGQGLCAGHRTR